MARHIHTYQSVACFMISSDLLFVFRHNRGPPLGSHHNFILSRLKLSHSNYSTAHPRCQQSSFIHEIGKALAVRFSRRTMRSRRRGPLDLRRTMRDSLRRGGEILELAHRQRKRQRLKLVLLCDVSKSMDLYSRFLIQFIYAFQSVYRRIETFVFSTSLYRVTETLQTEELEEALDRLTATVPDWSGGTKIGESLQTFVKHYGLSLVDHGTVVLVISDGWDTGDIEALDESMHFLKQHARSVLWLNPLMGNPGYEPTTRGMQAALPHLDLLVSAHNVASLRTLVRQLSRVQHGRQLRGA